MLGSMTLDVLSQQSDLSVSATVRTETQRKIAEHRYPHVDWLLYDAENYIEPYNTMSRYISRHQWVINCIGITKPFINDLVPEQVVRAIRVNALWPHLLAKDVSEAGHNLLQIATDCVFSGRGGPYAEPSTPDAHDVYGRTKSLGEVAYPGCTNLRTSIIGPEPGTPKFLLEWVKQHNVGTPLKGFVDHYWNGVTTLAFARVCAGIIRTRPNLVDLVHLVPKDVVSKYELLKIIASAYDRDDLYVMTQASQHKNMVLATHQTKMVDSLWSSAGYPTRPTIEALVQECAAYRFQHDPLN